MLKNYLKIALRSLLKDKLYTFIILIGLSLGITCCLLITLFVKHELSYENFHTNKNRLVRAIMDYNIGGNGNKGSYTSTYVGPSFQKNFPEVENFVRLTSSSKIVRKEDKLFVEKRFMYADSTIFDLFSFKLLSGDVKTALSGPNKVLLTKSMADKYFGTENPLGKPIKVSAMGYDYIVSGILEDCPKNTHLQFDFLASSSSLGIGSIVERTYWNANYNTYFLLKNEQSLSTLQPKIKPFMKKEMAGVFSDEISYVNYLLEPISTIHLYSEHEGYEEKGSIMYVYIMSVVALLILVIACFTYINLSTSKSAERAKEIGIRKVAGAYRSQIFLQFMSESFWLVLVSLLFSLLLMFLVLPSFSQLVNRTLVFQTIFSRDISLIIFCIIVGVSVFAGIYPAFVLSSLNPILVLKGNFKNTRRGLFLRKFIFSFQFAISVFLIIGAVILQKQLQYFQTKELGYDKELLVTLPYDKLVGKQFEVFKEELKSKAHVKSITKSDFTPNNIMGGYSMQKTNASDALSFGVNASVIDDAYLNTCGIELIAGKNITQQDIAQANIDTLAYFHFILNETAVKQMGWTAQEAVGKKMFLDATRPGEIKGVIKDFHFSSLHNPIKPLVLFPSYFGNLILVKLNKGNVTVNIEKMEGIWKKLFTHRPFDFSFLEDKYNQQYDSERRLGKALNVFTLIAILLAMLGLFGLSSYAIQQRAKEISIRKIVGNPLHAIVLNLSREFMTLILVACLVAIPLAWLVCQRWLENFSYRIDLSIWYFIIPCLLLIILAFVTVAVRVIRASMQNPVKNLRME